MAVNVQAYRRGKGYAAEMVLARGPREMGVTGTGTFEELFGYAWLALLDRKARRLRLFQARSGGAPWPLGGDPTGAEWAEVPVPDLLHPAQDVRHLALAFDQAARHVVAYEYEGEVWVRQWDAVSWSYVMRGPWPGADPVLVMDANTNRYMPSSDVLLFHLSPDRRTLVMRVQRELYETEHVVQTFDRDVVLDQALAAPYQIEVVGAYADNPDQPGVVIRSDLYPVRESESLAEATAGAPTSADYYPVVVIQNLGSESLVSGAAGAPTSADYHPVVVIQDLGSENLVSATAGALTSGSYHPIVVIQDLGSEDLVSATAGAPASSTYRLAVVVVDARLAPYGTENLVSATAGAPTGGSYV